jgi:hypothetical protein
VSSQHPYYRRRRPTHQVESDFSGDGVFVDLSRVALLPYEQFELIPLGESDPLARANLLLDGRAAALIRAMVAPSGTGDFGPVTFMPDETVPEIVELIQKGLDVPSRPRDLLEWKVYPFASTVLVPKAKCLAVLAYPDYFPHTNYGFLVSIVSAALRQCQPGWCGSIGPGIDGAVDMVVRSKMPEGNYDMSQMHLVPMAYAYYDDLEAEAREWLITALLARGTIHRPNENDQFTSGFAPPDWSRAGYISPLGFHKDIGETENHIMTILTARYLSNQLLHQRDPRLEYDNRRNSPASVAFQQLRPDTVFAEKDIADGSCTSLILALLQRILRDDFSEYNSKNYQNETRSALLNLCSFAYDHEVRLAARMVLDYISAHMAVSSNDLRRMLPFRRRNVPPHSSHDDRGFMTVGLLFTSNGADPMAPHFAMLAGNTRAYEWIPGDRPPWTMTDADDALLDVLSDYRLPPSIHDLFLNDRHRLFFQRLHRTVRPDEDEVGGHRNADNMEIFAGSPSYLISAGGSPAGYAIDPTYFGFVVGDQDQQLGVAVTTSFIPTGQSGSADLPSASEMIQFGSFADDWFLGAANYGVAPNFVCGHQIDTPQWARFGEQQSGFVFYNSMPANPGHEPGFYLALDVENGLAVMEAFDTWLHPGFSYDKFKEGVIQRNAGLRLASNVPARYKTHDGISLEFVIWDKRERDLASWGAKIIQVDYGSSDPGYRIGDAGNVTAPFLNGTVLNSTGDATVEITNPLLETKIVLDMSQQLRPRRVSEDGSTEQAGMDNEIWVDFDWSGAEVGDVCLPFRSLAAAASAVAPGGTIRMIPSSTSARSPIGLGKRFTLMAPAGGVKIGPHRH